MSLAERCLAITIPDCIWSFPGLLLKEIVPSMRIDMWLIIRQLDPIRILIVAKWNSFSYARSFQIPSEETLGWTSAKVKLWNDQFKVIQRSGPFLVSKENFCIQVSEKEYFESVTESFLNEGQTVIERISWFMR